MIYIDKGKKETLYMQVYHQIRDEILNGTLQEGTILAGSRGLAKTLHISRNTVDNAYSQLVAEGYIAPKRGIGFVVLKVNEAMEQHPAPKFVKKRESPENYTIENRKSAEIIRNSNICFDLTNSSHTSDLFPKSLWRKYTLECMDQLEREKRLSIHLNKQGEMYLRSSLLAYLKRIRGVHFCEDQIVITAGIQQSLDYLCKLFQPDQTEIWMEEPGYNKAAAVFKNAGRCVLTVPVDDNGMMVSKLPDSENIGAIYTTPSHQFPTGAILPIGRRYDLLKWAVRNHTYIIEDDFDSEQRYYAKPIPSLQSIDRNDCVIYLGTFSKALSPSIRMGYMILPPNLLKSYQNKFKNYNCTVPLLNQYVIGKLIESGDYDRHIRRLNHIFRKRLECFNREFADIKEKVRIYSNGSGQYFLLEFSQMVDQSILIKKAEKEGVKVYSTMQFWQDQAECPPNTLFLGFSKIDMKDIPDCVSRLKTAWKAYL